MAMQERLQALADLLPPTAQAALVVSEENRRYFTGFPSSAGVLIVSRGGSIFLTDSRYNEAARRTVTGCEVEDLGYGLLHLRGGDIHGLMLRASGVADEGQHIGDGVCDLHCFSS